MCDMGNINSIMDHGSWIIAIANTQSVLKYYLILKSSTNLISDREVEYKYQLLLNMIVIE